MLIEINLGGDTDSAIRRWKRSGVTSLRVSQVASDEELL